MGKTLSEDEKNKTSWDSNAITPGTPFMELLASSLRYWVVRKMNTDPGWKEVMSDARCSLVSPSYLALRWKSSSLTLVYLGKGSTKLWTSFDASGRTRDMTRIPDM